MRTSTTRTTIENGPDEAPGLGETRVRPPEQPRAGEPPAVALSKRGAAPAAQEAPTDYGGRPIQRLNEDWAVSDDGQLQWLLLRAGGETWRPRRYHVERDALLRSIRELCGPVDAAAVEAIGGWPALYRSGAGNAPIPVNWTDSRE